MDIGGREIMDAFTEVNAQKFITRWLDGIEVELKFWNKWISEHGGIYKEDFLRRTADAPKIEDEKFITFSGKPFRVLDAGAGPISSFGMAGTLGKIELTACDPLADAYAQVLKANNITPYVKTEFAYFERLTDRYEKNYFDHVHVRNALDHAFDALAGIYELLHVLKINATLRLVHAENEAVNEAYQGFHQWNFTEKNGDFIVWNQEININISDMLRDAADVTVTTKYMEEGRRLIDVAIHKKNTESILSRRSASHYFLDKALLNKLISLILEKKDSQKILDNEQEKKNKIEQYERIEKIFCPQHSLRRKIAKYLLHFLKK